MHRKLLISYFKNQRHLFLRHLYRTLKHDNVEDLHQLRVTIKKLRALWSLVEVISKSLYTKNEHRKLTGTLFNKGGKVREAQVNAAVINSLHEKYLKSSSKFMQKTEQKANVHLVAAVLLFDLNELKRLDQHLESVIKGIPNKVVFTESLSFISGKITRVRKLMKQLPDHLILHKIRIQLKSVSAIQAIIQKKAGEPKIEKLRKNILALNNLIGEWHDYDELLIMLNLYIERKLKKKEKKKIRALMRELKSSQKSRVKKIRKKLDQYLVKSSLKALKKVRERSLAK